VLSQGCKTVQYYVAQARTVSVWIAIPRQ